MSDAALAVKAVQFDERFLEASGPWVADPEMQALMLSSPVSREAQRQWFDGLPGRTDYVIWGIELEGQPIGAFGLKQMSETEAEYWGYIGEKCYWGRGIGKWMIGEAIEKAREHGVQRVYLKVVETNEVARRLYERMNFQFFKKEENLIWMERMI